MEMEALERLRKDLRAAAVTLTDTEARFLVDAYYMMQDDRKRSANQVRALGVSAEPHEILKWYTAQNLFLEKQIAAALDRYSASKAVGEWARAQAGIGPIIAAGLLAHIDIRRAKTAGDIWRYAGLDPSSVWAKGQKRPWNAQLKTLCWKIGESFVKVSGNPDAYYGQIYLARKAREQSRNEEGLFSEQAATILETKHISKETAAYASYAIGRLPPGHIHARAKRYAVKMFLSHLHHVWFHLEFGAEPPLPFAVAHLGHVDIIPPPPPYIGGSR